MPQTAHLSSEELKQFFSDENLHVTGAVKILLKQAALYSQRVRTAKADSETFSQQIANWEQSRDEYMYQAMHVAAQEKQQGWRFIEDEKFYVERMHDKYGDLDFITGIDDLKNLVTIYHLKDLAANQAAGHALEAVS